MTELYYNTAIPNYSIFASFFINQTKVFHYYQILNFLISLQFGQVFIFIIDSSNYLIIILVSNKLIFQIHRVQLFSRAKKKERSNLHDKFYLEIYIYVFRLSKPYSKPCSFRKIIHAAPSETSNSHRPISLCNTPSLSLPSLFPIES